MKSQLTTTKPRLYRVQFHGRKRGAIGIFYLVSINIPADSVNDARLHAYDNHESGGNPAIEVGLIAHACPNCGQWQYLNSDCYNECVRRGFAERVS